MPAEHRKIPTFKYCGTRAHLIPLQQGKYKSMIKRKYHIIYMDIHPSTIEAHRSKKTVRFFYEHNGTLFIIDKQLLSQYYS